MASLLPKKSNLNIYDWNNYKQVIDDFSILIANKWYEIFPNVYMWYLIILGDCRQLCTYLLWLYDNALIRK